MHKVKEAYETYMRKLENAIEKGSPKEVCDMAETVKNLGKILLIDDEIETGMEHQTSQRSYRAMPYYYANGVEPGRDEMSYRRGRDSMGRYTSRRDSSYGGDDTARILKKMLRNADGEEREALEKCLDMAEQYQ